MARFFFLRWLGFFSCGGGPLKKLYYCTYICDDYVFHDLEIVRFFLEALLKKLYYCQIHLYIVHTSLTIAQIHCCGALQDSILAGGV